MSVYERLKLALADGERCVVLTVVEGDGVGEKVLVLEGGERVGEAPAEVAALAPELIRGARSRLVEEGGRRVFAEVYAPPPRLLVFGAVDTAEALAKAAKGIGWRAIVADARPRFATPERMPSADELIVAWPEEVMERVAPDHATAVVTLAHDDKFDVPVILAALASEAFYIGAIGSRRTQERRREALLAAGAGEEELDRRLAGPCGLDLGADTPAEVALSIVAEALAARNGRGGGSLKAARARTAAPAG